MMKYLSFCGIVLLFLASSLSAQQGRVRVTGRILDGETGESLPGATIVVKGTSTGTITEMNGDYSILVPGAESVLVFSFLGFTDQEVTVGTQRTINIVLEAGRAQLDEVVITMQAKGQIGARNQQINSNTLVNVVSQDRLQENPDANAVEAIGRLPGISVLRSGGEGSQIVIRGLEPRYTNVTLEGVNLPASSGTNRGTNISGISQYVLQGVEVYKSLTPDMEANAVGGTVNLKLQDTPEGLHFNIMAQGGYNDLNSYFGNYKFLGEISNRFLDNKLGVFFSASAERVNRSTHTMSAGYGLISDSVDIYLNTSNLNIISRTNYRQSATLSIDYQLHRTTKLKLYGLYSHTNVDQSRQSKAYGHTGSGSVGYSMAHNPLNESDMIHTTLSGQTRLNFLNMEIDYGVAYSQNQGNNPDSRTWDFSFAEASTDDITTFEDRKLTPAELIPLYTDHVDSLHNTLKGVFGTTDVQKEDRNLTAYVDFAIPFSIGDLVTGNAKFGGKYRQKNRYYDALSGAMSQHPFQARFWYEAMPWLVMAQRGADPLQNHTLEGFEEYEVTDFLGGEYDYGSFFNFDMLNATSDWWESFSDSVFDLGAAKVLEIVGDVNLLGYHQSLEASMINDQKIVENYYAGYLMGEFNIGRWVMVMPGFRYETTDATMEGFETMEPLFTPSIQYPLAGSDSSATRADDFFLPMVHLKVKPSKSFYIHAAYTQTISRPDFNNISPNLYIKPVPPFFHTAQNPELRAELWSNFDVQATLHGNKIGLLSVSGFYKTVEDKIWNRSFKRIKGDELVYPFSDDYVVNVSIWENHSHEVKLQGIEFEWQTSFWYLPGPLKYFTLNLNYTYIHSETKYPITWIENVTPPEGGRPVPVRFDSVTTGSMLYQPTHIANVSLGFNYKGFNTWLSFQYNGEIFTSKNYIVEELDGIKEHFYRMDLQVTYDIPLKIPGHLQVIGNFANLTNFTEVSRLRGETRFTYQEAYGYTIDLGIRYKF